MAKNSELDLNVWSVSFWGIFLLKGGFVVFVFVVSVQEMETVFYCCLNFWFFRDNFFGDSTFFRPI